MVLPPLVGSVGAGLEPVADHRLHPHPGHRNSFKGDTAQSLLTQGRDANFMSLTLQKRFEKDPLGNPYPTNVMESSLLSNKQLS